MMAERVLVTGGAGYIGSVLVPMLLEAGYAVTVLDTFARGDTSLAACCASPDFTPVRGDARDERVVRELAAGADIVIPLAALVGAPLCDRDPVGAETINRDAVRMLTRLLSRDQRLIFPTTNSGYGIGEEGLFCTEETPLRPVSLYGTLKVELENYLLATGRAVSLRLATVCGISPRMRLDLLVNDFTYRAVTDRFVILFEAHFKRNYIHVQDVASAFIHAMKNFDSMKGQAYNVGLSEANLSKMELCLEIQKQIPDFCIMESEIGKDPDQRNYIVSNEKIEKTGFKPQASIQQAISELIKGYQVVRRHDFTNL